MDMKLLPVVMLATLPSVGVAGDVGGTPDKSTDSRSMAGGDAALSSTQRNNANGNGSDANGAATPSGSDSDANASQPPASGDANANKK
jgi:hypothetical protein